MQHAQHQDPENKADELNSAIVNLIIFICAFPTVTCQSVFCGKKKGQYAVAGCSLY